MKTALIIGGGPAGLMAADVLSRNGVETTIADAMPTLGRKFLMAGKSGLNLTKKEPIDRFLASFPALDPVLKTAIEDFDPSDVEHWAESLGQSVFVGSTKRVFPKSMKASPLLRAWISTINAQILTRHRWVDWADDAALFHTPEGEVRIAADVYILALGGASWARLGSDGLWADRFARHTSAFKASNVGFIVNWSEHMTKHMGKAVKGTKLSAGDISSRGEWIISERGIEGGGVYEISSAARETSKIDVDLLPDRTLDEIRTALSRERGKDSLSNFLRKSLRLDPIKIALLAEFGRPYPDDLAPLVKCLPMPALEPRPIDEAISTAGGLRFDALDDNLMFKDKPGVFCAGEMLDWDAPTGGYLLTACFATGKRAGKAAVNYLNR